MQHIFRETKSKITLKYSRKLDFPPHIHDDVELIYVKRGGGIAYCDGKKYELLPNSYFLVFPNQVHHYTDSVDGEYLVLIMKPSALLRFDQYFMKGIPENALFTPPAEDVDGLYLLIETARREYATDGYTDVIAAYLTAFFGKLIPFCPIERVSFPRENVLRILQYCSEHYKEDINIDSVAEQLSVSRSCVSHIFSSRLSISFRDYINSLRLTEAEVFLQNKNYSMTEVANHSGFPTIRTFNRAFLKKHGVSPSRYRVMWRAKSNGNG